ncbi:MAG: hypothetical protein JWM47_3067 [Acidimicrobiales bacterium]|nr:hypothetical protein [Acidimicrobiales bacterium]
MAVTNRIDRGDLPGLALLVIVALALLFAATRGGRPDEDAAMLMRYAVNFADGHGVAYNASQAPVDGATDLLVVPLAAGPIAAGMSPPAAFALVEGAAVLATVVLLYAVARRWGASRGVAVAVPLFVLTGRVVHYVHLGYAAPVFGLAVLVLWILVERTRRAATDRRWGYAMVAAGVVAGLVRPEGFAFLAMAFVSLLISLPTARRRDLLGPLGAAVVAVALVVAARWAYFGYPLPNPYYVKGDGAVYGRSLKFAVVWTVVLAWPALAVLAVGLTVRASRRLALAQVLPMAAVTGMWLLLSNATNRFGRFQYGGSMLAYAGAVVILPGLLAVLSTVERPGDRRRRAAMGWSVAAVALCGLAVQSVALAPVLGRRPATPHDSIGRALAAFDAGDRVLLTSEAGNIPLLSGWHTVDAYGLNDAAIAHAGGIDRARIASERPDVIVVHGNPVSGWGWGPMVGQLRGYAEANGYLLAAPHAGGKPFMRDDEWAVYVRADAPDADRIVTAVRVELAEDSY